MAKDKKKKGKKDMVTVVSIGVTAIPKKKLKDKMKKANMMGGGMANGKMHNYATGGMVTDKLNPGLKALAKERPDVVKKMMS
ncbi:MAG: hypothetical protein VW496_00410 [Pelagibacteraceae bacterium]